MRCPMMCRLGILPLLLLLPCSFAAECASRETQSSTVSSPEDAAGLAVAVSCSGGVFAVTWQGEIAIPDTISVGENTVVLIQGDGTAAATGNSRLQLFFLHSGASLTISGVHLKNGAAEDEGGLVKAEPGSSLLLENLVASNGTARAHGGCFAVGENATLTARHVTMEDGNSSDDGGLIFVMGGTVVLEDVTLRRGSTRSSGGFGGAISAGNYASVALDGCQVHDCSGGTGGAIFATLGNRLTVHNCSFVGNNALAFGGAIHSDEGSDSVNISNSYFAFNYVSGFGGAVFAQIPFTVTDSVFYQNVGGNSGGAIGTYPSIYDRLWQRYNVSRCNFTQNYAFQNAGGALATGTQVKMLVEDSVFDANSAVFGGAFNPIAAISVEGAFASISISRCNFTGNTVVKDGGAISTYGPVNVVLDKSNFRGNMAPGGDGGAIYMDDNSLLNGTGVAFEENTANGGGAVLAAGEFACAGCSFTKNSAGTGTGSGRGGAIFASNVNTTKSSLYISGSLFQHNTAAYGAGIQAAGDCDIQASNFTGNEATLFAGAVYLDDASTGSFSDCFLTGNTAGRAGGGIFASSAAQPVLAGVAFEKNNATCCHAAAEILEGRRGPESCVDVNWAAGTDPSLEECCNSGFYGHQDTCPACPEGFECKGLGLRYETLSLQPGLWRPSLTEIDDVRGCWRKSACEGGAPTMEEGPVGYCADGYVGPYCAVCDAGYAKGLQYQCKSCSGKSKKGAIAGVVFGVIIILLIICCAFYELWDLGNAGDAMQTSGVGWAMAQLRKVPWGKLRIPLVVFQILSQYVSITGIKMPSIYAKFLSWVAVFDLDLSWFLSVGCLVDITFYQRLLATTLLPPACAMLLQGTFAAVRRRERRKEAAAFAAITPTDYSEHPVKPVASSRGTENESGTAMRDASTTGKGILRHNGAGNGTGGYNGGANGSIMNHGASNGGANGGSNGASNGASNGGSMAPAAELGLVNVVKKPQAALDTPANQAQNGHREARGVAASPAAAAAAARPSVDTIGAASSKHAAAFMLLLFLIYSTVSTVVFQTFACDPIAALNESFLRADYRVTCNSPTHTAYMIYAGIMVVLYPVGIPVYYAYLLWRDRSTILEKGEEPKGVQLATPALRATWFLRCPYRSDRYYWEVMECGRRLLLTGFLVFIMPGTSGQAAVACLFAVASLSVFAVFWPHRDPIDAYMYVMGSLIIFMSMFLSLLVIGDVSSDQQSQNVFSVVLIVLNVGLVVGAIVQCYLIMRYITTREDATVYGVRAVSQRSLSVEKYGSRMSSSRTLSRTGIDESRSLSGTTSGADLSLIAAFSGEGARALADEDGAEDIEAAGGSGRGKVEGSGQGGDPQSPNQGGAAVGKAAAGKAAAAAEDAEEAPTPRVYAAGSSRGGENGAGRSGSGVGAEASSSNRVSFKQDLAAGENEEKWTEAP